MGRITPIVDYIRRVFTEEVYKFLSKTFRPQTTVQGYSISSCDKGIMFPDSEGWWPARQVGQRQPDP